MRIKLLRRKPGLVFGIILQWIISASAVSAQMVSLGPFNPSVPDDWHTPYEQFLAGLGATGVETIVGKTKSKMIDRLKPSDTAVFRIEDESNCDDDFCLTIVGHLDGQRFIGDALFFAGAQMTMHDVQFPLLGVVGAPYEFWSKHGRVLLFEMHQEWVVIPVTDLNK
jgi:hypothetical protein